jgi:tetratricopeptide (TPR) repeat protein
VPSVNNEEYLFTLATIYSKLDKNKKAITIFEKLLNLNNNSDEILSNLANEYQKIDNYSKSADMLERLLLLNKYNEINWYSYIITCEIAKNSKRSLSFIKNYIKSKPYDHEAWFYLGIIYQRMDNHLDAIESFDYSICIKEDYITAYTNKAESLSELGYYQKAVECCKETFKYEDPDAILYFDIGELYEKMDDLNKAKSYFYKCIRKDEHFAEAWYTLALILDLQDLPLEASYHIKKAIDINSSNVDYLFTYAQINEKIGFIKEAEIAYRKVLELDELDSESWLNYSHLLHKNESTNEAIEVLKKGVKLNPKNAELSYRLSAYLFQSGSENQALSIFEKALSIDYDLHEEFFQYFPSIKDNKNLLHLLIEYKK